MDKKILYFILISLATTPSVFANVSSEDASTCESVEACEVLIGNLNHELAQYQGKIESREETKQTLQTQQAEKSQLVEELQQSVLQLKTEIQQIEASIEENQMKQQELEETITQVRGRINKQMVFSRRDQYRNTFLMLISESENLIDLIKSFRTFERFSEQAVGDIKELKSLIQELNRVIYQLRLDKVAVTEKQTQLEEEEARLIEEIQQLIVLEQQVQSEIQQLQNFMMEAEEIKAIAQQQRETIIKESNEYFGLPTEHGYVTCELGGYIDANGYPHSGIDIGNYGNTQTKILASLPGAVTASGWHNAYGNYVMITHNVKGQVYTTLYAHLNEPPLVRVGEEVVKGQHIGYMGTTGNSTGVHLHFEIYKGYYAFPHAENPRDYLEFPLYW